MEQRFERALQHRLDALELRGRGHLTATARRRAMTQALATAMRLWLIAAAMCLMLALATDMDAGRLALVACDATLAALAASYLIQRRRRVVRRRAALALLDERLRLKDRIATTDEFSASPQRGGFEEAALEEAAPWLEQALTAEIASVEGPAGPSRRDLACGAAAIVLLLLALLVHVGRTPVSADAATPKGGARAAVRAALQAIGVPPRVAPEAGGVRTAATDARQVRTAQQAARSPADPLAGSAVTMAAAAAQAGAAGDQRGGAAGATAPSSPASAAAGMTAAQGAAGRGGFGGQGSDVAAAGMSGAKVGEQRSDSGQTPDGARPPARANPRAPAAPQAGGAQASTAVPRDARPRQTQPSSDGGERRRTEPSEDEGEAGKPSSERTDGGGGTTVGRGEDPPKRSRGISGLLLATPTEDRLIGMPGAGPVSTQVRAATPRDWRVMPGQAQDRGPGGGTAGRIARSAATPHDDRTLQNFFRRPGMVPATTPTRQR